MKTLTCKGLLLLFFLSYSDFLKAQNVIIVTIDGARYSETFGGGNTYIPHLYNDMRPLGTLYSNFRINYPSGYTETCPGHSAVETGTWQQIANDGTERPTKPTIFEYLRKQKSNPQSDCYVVTGKSKLNILAYSTYPGYGSLYAGTWVGDDDKNDSLTCSKVISVMRDYQPKILVVTFGQVDDAGHSGDWDSYLSAIKNVDSCVYQIWQHIQAGDFGYNISNTTLFITNDHGRHDDNHGGFTDHGDGCEGCTHIMLLALGKNVEANQVVDSAAWQIDIAPTVGLLLDFETPLAAGNALFEIQKSVSLTSPNGGENWVVGSSHNIIWTSSNITNVKIDYSIDNDSNWTNIISSIPASAETYEWIIPNTPSNQFRIRISDVDNNLIYDESDTSFTIKLSGTILIFPINNSTGISLAPILSWVAVSGAEKYRLEINTSADFSGRIIYDENTLSSTSKQVGGLFDNTIYYWKVTVLDSNSNSSDASSIFNFTTQQSILVAAVNGATSVSTSPTLTWNKTTGTNNYRLEVNINSDFSGTVIFDNSSIIDTTQTLSGLTNNTTYYWRVIASSNTLAKTTTSDVYSFTTKLANVNLISPADNSTGILLSPTLSWAPVPGADRYRLEVNIEADFSSTAIYDKDTVSLSSHHISDLSANTTYYWRVTAFNNNNNTSDKSNAFKFITANPTNIAAEKSIIPQWYELFQNYPNPFNPTTTIRYALPLESNIRILLYDVLGQEIKLLLSSTKSAGYHELTFDATNLASGIYFFRISATSTMGKETFVDTKKLMLMK